jgi:hypothetical protein
MGVRQGMGGAVELLPRPAKRIRFGAMKESIA